MFLKLSTLALLPVLIVQGNKVKKNTLRLAEPVGERTGQVGLGQALSLLILGDSSAAGVGVDSQDEALSGAIITELKDQYHLDWTLQAKSGDTTKQVLHAVKSLDARNYDVVITSMGVNDVTKLSSAQAWMKLQTQLFEQIQQKFQPKLIIVSGVPPMQHFPALPNPLAWLFGKYAAEMNHRLEHWVTTQDQFRFIQYDIKTFQALNLPMARDGFHPSKEIYAIWGEKVASFIRAAFKSE